MSAQGFTGVGVTVVFGTNTYSGKIRDVGATEQTRDAVESTTLDVGKTNFAKFIPGDNPDPGSTDVTLRWAGATAPQVFAAPETITITLPKEVSTSNNAASFAGTGFLTKRRGLPGLGRNKLNEGAYTIKWDGDTGPTYTPES